MKVRECDGVKVFEPTLAEFQDFGACIREIERQGAATTGLAKVNFFSLSFVYCIVVSTI
jgi:hypothetical protein